MLIDPRNDGHIHTALCNHATGTMEEYVLAAIQAGMHHICFLEHMEEGIASKRKSWLSEDDFALYFREGARLKEEYAHQISIGIGVEVGYNPEHVARLRVRIARREWDRIGLSYHFHRPPGENYHLNLVSKSDIRLQQLPIEQAEIIEKAYYSNLIDAVETIPATVLCHLDGVLRYHPQRDLLEPPWPLIEALLDTMQRKNIGLEINTSGLTIRGEVFPARKILGMALQRKLPLFAGSDSHRPEDVGYGFEKLEDLLRELESQ